MSPLDLSTAWYHSCSSVPPPPTSLQPSLQTAWTNVLKTRMDQLSGTVHRFVATRPLELLTLPPELHKWTVDQLLGAGGILGACAPLVCVGNECARCVNQAWMEYVRTHPVCFCGVCLRGREVAPPA